MSIERYYSLIEDGYNSLVHISHWEDPYEGFIYRGGMGQTDEQTNRIYDLYKSVYGQSWMFEHEESDVLWRAMANGERGNLVRVQTTVRKLAQSILSHVNTAQGSHKESSQSLGIRIARIVYKNDAKFDEMLNPQEIGRILNGNDMDGQLDFLFFKRCGFKAEKEVRVVVLANKNRIDSSKCKRGDLLKFEIDPNKLIDGVLADPCMDRREYERLICRTKFALSDDAAINLIKKSKLFDWPVIK